MSSKRGSKEELKRIAAPDAHTRSIQMRRVCLQHGPEAGLILASKAFPYSLLTPSDRVKDERRWVSEGEVAAWCTLFDQLGHNGMYVRAVELYDKLHPKLKERCGDRALVSVLNSIAEYFKTGKQSESTNIPPEALQSDQLGRHELVRTAIRLYNEGTSRSVFPYNVLLKVCQFGGTKGLLEAILDGQSGLLTWYPTAMDAIGMTTAINAGIAHGLPLKLLVKVYNDEMADEQLGLAMLQSILKHAHDPSYLEFAVQIANRFIGNIPCQSVFLQILTFRKDHHHIGTHFKEKILPLWNAEKTLPDHLIVCMVITAYVHLNRLDDVFKLYEHLRRHLDLRDSPRIIESLIRACRQLGNHCRGETIFSHAFLTKYNLGRRKNVMWPTEKCIEELKGVWRERLGREEAEKKMEQLDSLLDEHSVKLKQSNKQSSQRILCQ